MEDPQSEKDKEKKGCPERYEGDQFIWSKQELDEENLERQKRIDAGEEEQTIPIVLRDKDFNYTFGIRAHPNMDWKKCLWSFLVPWHNEWLNILLYLGFAIYFWVQCGLIIASRPGKFYRYNFEKTREYHLMFVVTFGFALSLTMTTAYLIFYPISQKINLILDGFDYMGKLIMVFSFTFVFLYDELEDSPHAFFPLTFVTVCIILANLVFLQYQYGRLLTFWLSMGVCAFIYTYDFAVHSTPKQKRVFFIPMFIELIMFTIGWLLYFY